MSIKETIVDCLVKSGYDFMTACELATAKIKEIKTMDKGKHTFFAGKYTITISKD